MFFRTVVCLLVSGLVLLAQNSRAEEVVALNAGRVKHIDFRELPLSEAARLLSEQTGLNIVTTAEARKSTVSLFIRNVSARAAIEELVRSHNLTFKQDPESGIVRIMTLTEFQRDLVTNDESKTEVFTMLYPNAVAISLSIRDLFGERVRMSLSNESAQDESRELEDRFQRFDVLDQRGQGIGLFSGGGTSTGGGFSGGGSGGSRGGSSFGNGGSSQNNDSGFSRRSDFVRQNRENSESQRRGGGAFRDLTPEQAQAVQKIVEGGRDATEKESALQTYRQQAAEIYLSLSRKNNMMMVRTSDQGALKEIRELVKRLDVPTSLVLLEVKVMSVELGDGFNSVFDYQFSDGVNNAGGFNTGDVQPPLSDVLSGAARKAASLALGGTGIRAGDLTFQFVNDNFRARIQMLDTKNRLTVLATPVLLTANNEVSRLFVGEERPIIRNISSQTVVNDNTVTSVPNTTVEFRPVGTTLLITPNINSDRTVTLRILQENSSINPGAATIPVVTSTGQVQSQPVDVVSTRTVSGMVVAKDNLTVAVGGLIEDTVRDARSQVPILGKIPVIGIPFRKVNNGRTRSEMVILIRPHIISTPSEAEAISRQLIGDLSIHPKAPDAEGAMKTFTPREVLKPDPPTSKRDSILRLDSVKHSDE